MGAGSFAAAYAAEPRVAGQGGGDFRGRATLHQRQAAAAAGSGSGSGVQQRKCSGMIAALCWIHLVLLRSAGRAVGESRPLLVLLGRIGWPGCPFAVFQRSQSSLACGCSSPNGGSMQDFFCTSGGGVEGRQPHPRPALLQPPLSIFVSFAAACRLSLVELPSPRGPPNSCSTWRWPPCPVSHSGRSWAAEMYPQ